MNEIGWFGVALILMLAAALSAAVSSSRLPTAAKLLVVGGIVLRLVGSLGRNAIAADANIYLRWGKKYAEYFREFDFSPLFDELLWRSPVWTGTNFIGYPTGLIIALIGESRIGTFFAFALIGMAGVAAFAVAFRRAFPRLPYLYYWAWIFLFPSIWFWPSSVGKEAIMMFGLGIATLGFVGKRQSPNWIILAVGVLCVYAVRPQVAAVLLLAVVMSYWLKFDNWSVSRVLQGVVILVVGLAAIWYTLQSTIGGAVEIETLQGYVAQNAEQAQIGGSAIERVQLTPLGVLQALVNVLFRPFIWEAGNANMLFASIELMSMWAILLLRRRQIVGLFKVWRSNRVLRFAVPFVLLYTLALGFNLTNLGIIARQRVLMFPLLFMVIEAGHLHVMARSQAPAWLRRRSRSAAVA